MSAKVQEESDESKPKWKGVIEARSYYNRHFPTDKKTFNYRLPFVGFVLSMLAFNFVSTFFFNYFFYTRNEFAAYAYIVIAFGVSFELYYGLNIGDRKQYTPWIILKIIEIVLILSAIIYCLAANHSINGIASYTVYGFILFFLNIGVSYIVITKSLREFYGTSTEITDDNIYDNCNYADA